MTELVGKVAVVTGGGRGIGRAIALGYAQDGAEVLVAARTRAEIEAVADEIRAAGGAARAVVADISREEDVRRLVADVEDTWGRVDVLVNNAGVPGPQGLIHELDMSEVNLTWAVNVRGTFLCCRVIVPLMLGRGGGNVINVSSGAGQRKPRPRVRSVPYQVSKFAVEGLTNALAVQLRDEKINVNALQPGRIATRLHDTTPEAWLAGRKMGRPEDAVPAALFLARLEPGAMTGFSLEASAFNRGFRPALRDYTVG